jgi:hypothetical protein
MISKNDLRAAFDNVGKLVSMSQNVFSSSLTLRTNKLERLSLNFFIIFEGVQATVPHSEGRHLALLTNMWTVLNFFFECTLAYFAVENNIDIISPCHTTFVCYWRFSQ